MIDKRPVMSSSKSRGFSLIFAVILSVAVIGIATQTALAHARIEIGPYAIVVGWLEEPAIVGERNALLIEINEGENPIEGLEATLNIELLYGGRTFRTNLSPSLTPGLYEAEIFPTVRGQYAVRLFGTIEDLEIDETIKPEEVFPASRIQFPEAQPDPLELQKDFVAQISALESQLQTARLLAVTGVVLGLVGVILALNVLRRPHQG